MLTLAIDTSARNYSIALFDRDRTIAEVDSRILARGSDPSTPSANASVSLFPQLKSLLDHAACRVPDIQLIAVATGPGMFTGLRIGVVTAKSLAYISGAPVVGVNTLEAIARQSRRLTRHPGRVRAVLNAQRQQLFSASFEIGTDGQQRMTEESAVVNRSDWMQGIRADDLLTGSGLKPLITQLEELGHSDQIASEESWESGARTIGEIGLERHRMGQTDDFWDLQPLYFRPSYAEETRN